jgi:plastocyanin
MAKITIKRDNNVVSFHPNKLTLGNNDFVIWANEDAAPDQDPSTADGGRHWPTPAGKADDWWMSDSLPPAQAGQPSATSPNIAFGARGTADQVINYVCALHPGEQGTIVIPKKP